MMLFFAAPVWAATQTYTNTRFLYSVDYPDAWRVKEIAGSAHFLSPFESKEDKFAENVTVSVEYLGGLPEVTLLDYHQKAIREAPDRLQDFKVLEEARTEFLGFEAVAVLYTATVKGRPFKFKDYKFMIGKDVYVLTYTALSDDFDKYLRAAEKVMHSLRVSP